MLIHICCVALTTHHWLSHSMHYVLMGFWDCFPTDSAQLVCEDDGCVAVKLVWRVLKKIPTESLMKLPLFPLFSSLFELSCSFVEKKIEPWLITWLPHNVTKCSLISIWQIISTFYGCFLWSYSRFCHPNLLFLWMSCQNLRFLRTQPKKSLDE